MCVKFRGSFRDISDIAMVRSKRLEVALVFVVVVVAFFPSHLHLHPLRSVSVGVGVLQWRH
jgi:hypothetical protein